MRTFWLSLVALNLLTSMAIAAPINLEGKWDVVSRDCYGGTVPFDRFELGKDKDSMSFQFDQDGSYRANLVINSQKATTSLHPDMYAPPLCVSGYGGKYIQSGFDNLTLKYGGGVDQSSCPDFSKDQHFEVYPGNDRQIYMHATDPDNSVCFGSAHGVLLTLKKILK